MQSQDRLSTFVGGGGGGGAEGGGVAKCKMELHHPSS